MDEIFNKYGLKESIKCNVLVGVCGGIAAYKACDVVSKLTKLGMDVQVVMTQNATQFVSPLTFATLSKRQVAIEQFDKSTVHIDLSKWADLVLIVPATANTVSKIANGLADNLLTTTILASTCPIVIAPAMNSNMYSNPIYVQNQEKLINAGYGFVMPESGTLACGDVGIGKLALVDDIVQTVVYCAEKVIADRNKNTKTSGSTLSLEMDTRITEIFSDIKSVESTLDPQKTIAQPNINNNNLQSSNSNTSSQTQPSLNINNIKVQTNENNLNNTPNQNSTISDYSKPTHVDENSRTECDELESYTSFDSLDSALAFKHNGGNANVTNSTAGASSNSNIVNNNVGTAQNISTVGTTNNSSTVGTTNNSSTIGAKKLPQDLKGKTVLVTVGGTRHYIDPVRFIGNMSSGKMGLAIAECVKNRGGNVILVHGNVSVPIDPAYYSIKVDTTMDMYVATMSQATNADYFIMSAAPSDYEVDEISGQKIKSDNMQLNLKKTIDISKAIGKIKLPTQKLVVFCAETENLLENARIKLASKNADIVVANDITQEGAGFNTDTNIATIITKTKETSLPLMTKVELADIILDNMMEL